MKSTIPPTKQSPASTAPLNRIHLLATAYPFNTRKILFDYGFITEEGCVRGLSIPSIPGEDGHASYQYAGLDRTVKLTYVIPEIDLSYISPDGEPGGDAGDPYTGWDRFGRTQDLRWSKGEDLLDQTRYGYNRSSQRTWREAPLATSGNDEAYQYDGLYQITGRQRGDLNTNHTAIGSIPVRAESFDYDPIGNWKNYEVSVDGTLALDQSRVHDQANTLTQIDASSALLAHDPAGNMTLCPPPADGDWDEALTLVWDVWNRLTEVRSEDGTTLIAKYTYDGLWRRITRQICTGPVIHTYYNAQWRPLQETEDDGTTVTLARTYDWGLRYRDDLIRRINHLHDDEAHYALHDYYNITAIIGCTGGSSSNSESHADASIAVLERYGYSAFGDVRFMTAAYVTKPTSDHAWDLLYKAQFRDQETGFYNYGYRYLSPMLGRWLSRDPIGEWGGLNLFRFIDNNINQSDYLGLSTIGDVLQLLSDPQKFFEKKVTKELTGIVPAAKIPIIAAELGRALAEAAEESLRNSRELLQKQGLSPKLLCCVENYLVEEFETSLSLLDLNDSNDQSLLKDALVECNANGLRLTQGAVIAGTIQGITAGAKNFGIDKVFIHAVKKVKQRMDKIDGLEFNKQVQDILHFAVESAGKSLSNAVKELTK